MKKALICAILLLVCLTAIPSISMIADSASAVIDQFAIQWHQKERGENTAEATVDPQLMETLQRLVKMNLQVIQLEQKNKLKPSAEYDTLVQYTCDDICTFAQMEAALRYTYCDAQVDTLLNYVGPTNTHAKIVKRNDDVLIDRTLYALAGGDIDYDNFLVTVREVKEDTIRLSVRFQLNYHMQSENGKEISYPETRDMEYLVVKEDGEYRLSQIYACDERMNACIRLDMEVYQQQAGQ